VSHSKPPGTAKQLHEVLESMGYGDPKVDELVALGYSRDEIFAAMDTIGQSASVGDLKRHIEQLTAMLAMGFEKGESRAALVQAPGGTKEGAMEILRAGLVAPGSARRATTPARHAARPATAKSARLKDSESLSATSVRLLHRRGGYVLLLLLCLLRRCSTTADSPIIIPL